MRHHIMPWKDQLLLLVQRLREISFIYTKSHIFPVNECPMHCLFSWLRDNLDVIKDVKELAEVTETVEDCGGVYFVPAFSGLYAPYWQQEARG